MERFPLLWLGFALIAAACARADDAADIGPVAAVALAKLPFPITNNAVVSVTVAGRQYLVSFAGLASGKTHADTLDVTLILDSGMGHWRESAPLPGGVGRLASVAVSVAGMAYVFGGYSVDADGSEVSTPYVHAFDPASDAFSALSAMPVPVDDAVAVTYRDRYVYLVSGWHDHGNVNLVQRYDVLTDTWAQASPIPGPAVFGHAGGIIGNRIVYCDGVMIRAHGDRRRDFVSSDACFLGIIDEADSRRIDWRTIPPHPGKPRYRMAGAGIQSLGAVLFVGGSGNPYNYNGIGYDGEPSEPIAGGLWFDLKRGSWRRAELSGPATMDHRGLARFAGHWVTVGGMQSGQSVSDSVLGYQLRAAGQDD